jgi:hypothetical protein
MLIADHESDTERKVEPLQHPNGSYRDHREADKTAHDSHEDVEYFAHASLGSI